MMLTPECTAPTWQTPPVLTELAAKARTETPCDVAAREGDVLIRPVPGTRSAFALSAVPGPDQVMFASMAEAARVAAAYAHQASVDVWTDEGPGPARRLSRFCVGEGDTASQWASSRCSTVTHSEPPAHPRRGG